MNAKIFAVLCLFLAASFAGVKGEMDEYGNEMEDYAASNDATVSDEKVEKPAKEEKKAVVESEETQTTALVEQDSGDSDADKHKGFCHWGVAVWYKPGFSIRCSCMRCTCTQGGNWACAYYFPFCPYYYCGNQIYNPNTQICCCGKVYTKQTHHACCGYFYYNVRISKCCNYYSVKPRKANCPRYQI